MHIQSTLALRTPRYHVHPLIADGSQPPGITHKEMTERDSRYYENANTSMPPSATFYSFFSFTVTDTRVPRRKS